jgi:hypothetical protein
VRYLNKATDYTHGMELDYNDYYCSCNLPQLFVARGKRGDSDRAATIDWFVLAACDRALKRGQHDEWLRPTLLGAAFRAQDADKAARLADQVEEEGRPPETGDHTGGSEINREACRWRISTLRAICERLERLKE